MVANISDRFMKQGGRGARTTLASPGKSPSDTSVTLTNPAEWQTDTAIVFSLFIEDPVTHQEQANSYTVWKGVLSGSTVSNLVQQYGPNGVTYPTGSVAVMHISAAAQNSLIDGVLVSHNQDGTLKDSIVTTTKLASKAATLAKIDGGTTAGLLKTDASGVVSIGTKTVDANGWTVYDYGGWKEYRKRVTSSVSISAGGTTTASLSSSNLPLGMSSLGTNSLTINMMTTSFAYAYQWNAEMSSTSTELKITVRNIDGVSMSGTLYWDFTIVNQ